MINDNISKMRKLKKISQRELARRCGISGQMISKIENNLSNPSIETLNKIAEVLEVSLSDLTGIEVSTCKIDEDGNLIKTNDTQLEKKSIQFRYNQENGTDIGLPFTKENYKLDKSRFFIDMMSKYINEVDNDALKLIISNIENVEILKNASEYINAQIDLLEGNLFD